MTGDESLGDVFSGDRFSGDSDLGDNHFGDAYACTDCWRSSLYPENWQLGSQDAEGRFLHDFSFAGYRNGGVERPT